MRKRKDFIRLEGVRSARLVVIAAEGRDTENIYFEAVKRHLKASNVHVEVLHRENNNSSPENVYSQISDFKKEYNIEQDDELWIVVDRDRWTLKSLAGIARLCRQNQNLRFGVSNPCFELWLLLHFDDISTYEQEDLAKIAANRKSSRRGSSFLKQQIRERMGSYQESNYDADSLMGQADTAIARAEVLDIVPTDRWPQGVGTRVYLLMKSVMDKDKEQVN